MFPRDYNNLIKTKLRKNTGGPERELTNEKLPEAMPARLQLPIQVHLERNSDSAGAYCHAKLSFCWQTVCTPSRDIEGQTSRKDLSPVYAWSGCYRAAPN